MAGTSSEFPASRNSRHIAMGDGANWTTLGAGLNGAVNAITLYNGTTIAGGAFTSSGGSAGVIIIRVSRWNGANWTQSSTSASHVFPLNLWRTAPTLLA